MAKKLRIILDANVWVSLAIGKHINASLEKHLLENSIKLLSCDKLLEEVIDVLNRPRISKKLVKGRIAEVERFILSETVAFSISDKIKLCRDPDDDYLLNLAVEAKADYLVTNDKDLLVLDPFQGIKIIEYFQFISTLDRDRCGQYGRT